MINEFYKNLPKKRMSAGVLIFNDKNELLIVKPSYKDYWTIPGGGVDENESPRQAGFREVEEEVGIELSDLKFLCVDYRHAQDKKNDGLHFIFYGGRIKPEQKIKIDNDEIVDYKFVDLKTATELLGGPKRNLVKRLPKCIEAIKEGIPVYLENGE